MPATTPVYSGFAPRNLARIMSCPGPRAPRRTPRISTSIGSGFVPENTVQAVAICPRWTWLSGKKPPPGAGGPSVLGDVVCAHIDATDAETRATANVRSEEKTALRQELTSIRLNRVRIGPGDF